MRVIKPFTRTYFIYLFSTDVLSSNHFITNFREVLICMQFAEGFCLATRLCESPGRFVIICEPKSNKLTLKVSLWLLESFIFIHFESGDHPHKSLEIELDN